ncbi:MAG: hypothetical protein IPP16_11515 [Acidimicrobiaceae bacterium]|nr:hypothetical protein [Acidimicrobiaceae bacterium]
MSMHSPASRSVLSSATCMESSCHSDELGSPQYQRNDIFWNDDRLRPSLNEMRTAMSTGSNDHST